VAINWAGTPKQIVPSLKDMKIIYYDEVSSFTSKQWDYIMKRGMKMEKAQVDEVFKYHAPSEEQIESLKAIRDTAKILVLCILNECPASADRTTAIRKIREAVMTANASIVLNGLV